MPLEEYPGLIVDANMALEYNLLKPLGLGIGYSLLRAHIKAQDDVIQGVDLPGDYTVTLQGFRIYGKLYF